MEVVICLFLGLLALYNYYIFKFLDTIISTPRVKKVFRIPAIIINALTAYSFIQLNYSMLALFLTLFILIFAEALIYYKEKLLFLFFTASSIILHFTSIIAICIAVNSLLPGYSIYKIANTTTVLIPVLCFALSILTLFLAVVSKGMASLGLNFLTASGNLIMPMGIWACVFNIYLFVNTGIYATPVSYAFLAVNQIVMATVILCGLYMIMFFTAKISTLLGYKKKSEELQLAMEEEQLYRNSMEKTAIDTFEINITKNVMLKGLTEFKNTQGKEKSYTGTIERYAIKTVYSEDVRNFIKCTSIPYLQNEYNAGKREVSIEYRALNSAKEYIWVRMVLNIARDIISGGLKAYVYIKNIDEEKKQQIELQYKAERDLLTGLYNKGTTTKLICEQLTYNQRNAKGALLMIDIDNFKTINDSLGHTYGDAVLSELADKLKEVFRGDDIVGRIGGDEFIAFMKNAEDVKVIEAKAQKILKLFANTYKGIKDEHHSISGSVGIALFPKDGSSFESLYKNADIALYHSKSIGKNSYSFYVDNYVFGGYVNTRTEIDSYGAEHQKSFKENRIEYVFKMLYGSKNPIDAICSVLELIARHFKFERGYIFETSEDGKTTSNTFEWCEEGTEPQIKNLQNLPIEAAQTANKHFYQNGMYIVKSIGGLPDIEREILEPQGVKSMLQFGIFDDTKLLGFVGFDNCKRENVPSNKDIEDITTICNILSTFFVKQQISTHAKEKLTPVWSVINQLDNYTYGVNKETLEVVFISDHLKTALGEEKLGGYCYKYIHNCNAPCKDCPLTNFHNAHTTKMHNAKLNMWFDCSVAQIDNATCIVNCTDISKYEKENVS